MLQGVNKQITLLLTATVTSCLLLACTSQKEAALEHLKKGKDYYAKGEFDKALLELKTSAQGDKLSEAYYYTALLDERSKSFKAMHANLTKAVELDPKLADARLKLGQLDLLFGDLSHAQTQAETLLQAKADDVPALLLKASVLSRQKKTTEALSIIDQVLSSNADNIDALSLKAGVFFEKNDLEQALAITNAALQKDEKNVPLRLFKVKIFAKQNNLAGVTEEYKTLVSLYPETDSFKLSLASIYAMAGQVQPAETLLREMVAKSPDKVEPKEILLDFLKAKARERVPGEYTSFLEQHQQQAGVMLELSKWMLKSGFLEEANQGLMRIVSMEGERPIGLTAKTLMAEIALNQNKLDEVAHLLDELLKTNANFTDAQLLNAQLLLKQQQPDAAIGLLNKVTWDKDNSDNAHMLLGQAYLQKQDRKQADNEFKQALQINPANLQAFMPFYGGLLQDKHTAEAREYLERALQVRPNDVILLSSKVDLDIREKKWDDAQDIVRNLALFSDNGALPYYLQANIFQGREQYGEAIKLYEKILAEFPGHLNSMVNLVRSHEALKTRPQAVAFLEKHQAKHPDDASIAMVLSDMYVANQDYAKAKKLLATLEDKMPKVTQLYFAQAKVQAIVDKNITGVKTIYEQGLKHNPQDVRLTMALANWHEQMGNFKEAQGLYQSLITLHPNLEALNNNLALSLIEHGEGAEGIDAGLKLIEKFKQSDSPEIQDTYAWGLVKAGRLPEALGILQKLIVQRPKDATFRYHLGFAFNKSGNKAAAIAELRQALTLGEQQKANFPDYAAAEKLLHALSTG